MLENIKDHDQQHFLRLFLLSSAAYFFNFIFFSPTFGIADDGSSRTLDDFGTFDLVVFSILASVFSVRVLSSLIAIP